jgi:hypothetical protein
LGKAKIRVKSFEGPTACPRAGLSKGSIEGGGGLKPSFSKMLIFSAPFSVFPLKVPVIGPLAYGRTTSQLILVPRTLVGPGMEFTKKAEPSLSAGHKV